MSAQWWTVIITINDEVFNDYVMADDWYPAFSVVAKARPDAVLVAAFPGMHEVYSPSDDNGLTCYGKDYPTE